MTEMRHPRLTFVAVLGVLALGGYVFGVASALSWFPVASGVVGVLWALPVIALAALAWARFMPGPPSRKLIVSLVLLCPIGPYLAWHFPESKFLPNPYVDTCFAPGFKRESFDRLHPGMSPAEVEAVTGPPRFLHGNPRWYRLAGNPDLVWSYSTDHCSKTGDYAWRSYQVGFRDGALIVVAKDWRYD